MLNTSLVDYIYKLEKEKIVNLEYKLGQKITLKEKSEEYDVSITPIIQVLNNLVKDELISKKSRKGYYIKTINRKELEDLYDVREIIEVESLKMFKRINREELEILLTKAKELQKNVNELSDKKPKEYCDFEKIFHLFIVHNSNNQFLIKWYESIFPLIQISQSLGSLYKKAMEEHIKIINILLVNNIRDAIKELRVHIENCKQSGIISLDRYCNKY